MIGATNQFATRFDATQNLLSAYYQAANAAKPSAQSMLSDAQQKTTDLTKAAIASGDKVSISPQAYQRLQEETSSTQNHEKQLEAIRSKATKSPREIDLLIRSDQRLSAIFSRSPQTWTSEDIDYVKKIVGPANVIIPANGDDAANTSTDAALTARAAATTPAKITEENAALANASASAQISAQTAPSFSLIAFNTSGRSATDNLKMYTQRFGAPTPNATLSAIGE